MQRHKLTPAQRSERAKIAANKRWAHEPDRRKATEPMREGALNKLMAEVDPFGELPEKERQRRAQSLRNARLASMRLKSSKVRQNRNGGPL